MFDDAQTNLQLYALLERHGYSDGTRVAAAGGYALATRLFAGQYRSSGKGFLAHLVGTASILARHRAAPSVVLAGLLHAVYLEGEWGDGRPGATPARRAAVRGCIGDEAEAHVVAYGDLHWSRFEPESDLLRDRVAKLSALEKEAALITVANELEEGLDLGLAVSGAERIVAGLSALNIVAQLADALDRPSLAGEVRACIETTTAAVTPPGLVTGRAWGYTIHSQTLLQRVKSALRARLRRDG